MMKSPLLLLPLLSFAVVSADIYQSFYSRYSVYLEDEFSVGQAVLVPGLKSSRERILNFGTLDNSNIGRYYAYMQIPRDSFVAGIQVRNLNRSRSYGESEYRDRFLPDHYYYSPEAFRSTKTDEVTTSLWFHPTKESFLAGISADLFIYRDESVLNEIEYWGGESNRYEYEEQQKRRFLRSNLAFVFFEKHFVNFNYNVSNANWQYSQYHTIATQDNALFEQEIESDNEKSRHTARLSYVLKLDGALRYVVASFGFFDLETNMDEDYVKDLIADRNYTFDCQWSSWIFFNGPINLSAHFSKKIEPLDFMLSPELDFSFAKHCDSWDFNFFLPIIAFWTRGNFRAGIKAELIYKHEFCSIFQKVSYLAQAYPANSLLLSYSFSDSLRVASILEFGDSFSSKALNLQFVF
ncbi:hypothetical protein CHISP_2700 [Chitinispirillum alkaliphilum]|nr:hypothetical protein CHISP_2700 [Chitinispirillum alkaliphilum]